MTDLKNFYGFGKIWPLGIPISQSWFDVGTILTIIQKLNIKTFFEIGADQGGLSVLLAARTLFAEDFNYVGAEIKENHIGIDVLGFISYVPNAKIHIADAFSLGIDFTDHFKPWLIFCDGGDKVKELQHFAKRLTPGNYIMAHDYAKEIKEEDCQVEGVNLRRIVEDYMKYSKLILFEVTE